MGIIDTIARICVKVRLTRTETILFDERMAHMETQDKLRALKAEYTKAGESLQVANTDMIDNGNPK